MHRHRNNPVFVQDCPQADELLSILGGHAKAEGGGRVRLTA